MADANPFASYQQQYGAQANAAADRYGIPREIFNALIAKESTWNIAAVGGSGEYGLTQLLPSTAADLGVNPYDVSSNIAGGAAYLKQQFAKFGNWGDALAAYNAGAGNIQAGQGYAADVLKAAEAAGYKPAAGTATPAPAAVPIFGMTFDVPGLGDLGTILHNALDYPAAVANTVSGGAISMGGGGDSELLTYVKKLFSAEFWQGALWYIVGFVALIAIVLFGIFQLSGK